jgi:hypothetical protein
MSTRAFFLHGRKRKRIGPEHGETDDKHHDDGARNPEKGLARAFQAFVPFDHPARILRRKSVDAENRKPEG